MIYEYRAYYALPGKLPALLDRFERHTLGLFQKHQIRVVGFWRPDVGDSTELVYLCAFRDHAHREAAWAAFDADPEWRAIKHRTEADGPLYSRIEHKIWKPVPFLPEP